LVLLLFVSFKFCLIALLPRGCLSSSYDNRVFCTISLFHSPCCLKMRPPTPSRLATHSLSTLPLRPVNSLVVGICLPIRFFEPGNPPLSFPLMECPDPRQSLHRFVLCFPTYHVDIIIPPLSVSRSRGPRLSRQADLSSS